MDSEIQEEHHRLLRALRDSITRESELLRQLRRMKEALAAAGLKLQLSVKVAQDDELIIRSLRKEALEARKEAIVSAKRADTAVELVQSLRLELFSLKRQLKKIKDDVGFTAESERDDVQDSSIVSSSPLRRSDAEVDQMITTSNQDSRNDKFPNFVTANTPHSFHESGKYSSETSRRLSGNSMSPLKTMPHTPFQEWKVRRFLWTPDTPAASEFQDAQAVDSLAAMSLKEITSAIARPGSVQHLRKPIISSAAKTKRPLSSLATTNADGLIPSNVLDISNFLDQDEDDVDDEVDGHHNESSYDTKQQELQGRNNKTTNNTTNNNNNTTTCSSTNQSTSNRRRPPAYLPSMQRTQELMDKMLRVDDEMQRFLQIGSNGQDQQVRNQLGNVPSMKSRMNVSSSSQQKESRGGSRSQPPNMNSHTRIII